MNIEQCKFFSYLSKFILILIFPDHRLFDLDDSSEENENEIIRWRDFEPKSSQFHSFWSWFYSVALLTRDDFWDQWNSNGIFGFISKSEAKKILETCRPNTILLRFDDRLFPGGEFSQSIRENYRCDY